MAPKKVRFFRQIKQHRRSSQQFMWPSVNEGDPKMTSSLAEHHDIMNERRSCTCCKTPEGFSRHSKGDMFYIRARTRSVLENRQVLWYLDWLTHLYTRRPFFSMLSVALSVACH